MMNQNSTSASTVFLALLGGAALGAGLALLYAPQSGRKTRRAISDMGEDAVDYAHDLIEKAEEALEEAKEKGEEWITKGQEMVEQKKRQFATAVDHR